MELNVSSRHGILFIEEYDPKPMRYGPFFANGYIDNESLNSGKERYRQRITLGS
jgi:hypothetical protein